MQEPFDVLVNGVVYSVFPEEDNIYTIFKAGVELGKIEKDTENLWLKLDPETELPVFNNDDETNRIGAAINAYVPEEEDEEDEEEFE
ncbi:hypothetical protein [Mucilaginibacter pedocola]|uniref:Uncharacterized protein n=1 Tax=Mucilaginibacter pedocola TaxID=1792845 RepID=A0A1S9PAI5_9SPHI|nr:hypothetical protein [Mucilaginibacter pedocola]OOQ57993.1 hypothetical protein BC343_10015 [Mucilaginibacter pedocola]